MLPFYEIQPSGFTVINNKKELSFREHMHKYIEILYVFSGSQHISVSGKNYCVREGEGAVIFPEILHSYHTDSQKIADTLIILVDFAYISPFFPSLEYACAGNPVIHSESITEEVRFSADHIRKTAATEKRLGYTLVVFSELYKALDIYRRDSVPARDIVPRLISYISLNYAKPLTRESLAKGFNLSKYHISRIFSQKFGMNLKTYLGRVRSEKAALLIRSGDFTMTEISRIVGFESIRTFNRAFRQNMGMSPTEYKKIKKS